MVSIYVLLVIKSTLSLAVIFVFSFRFSCFVSISRLFGIAFTIYIFRLATLKYNYNSKVSVFSEWNSFVVEQSAANQESTLTADLCVFRALD